jgi:hypothetical protein
MKETLERIVTEAIAKAKSQQSHIDKALEENKMWRELDQALDASGMETSIIRNIVNRAIPTPILDDFNARGLLDKVDELAKDSGRAYLALVRALRANVPTAEADFKRAVVFWDSSGEVKAIASVRFPIALGDGERDAMLHLQRASFARMANEIDERIRGQTIGIH